MGILPDLLTVNGERITGADGWRKKREMILAEVTDLMGHADVEKVPLDPETSEETDCGTYVRQHVSFASEKGDRIAAFLCTPKGAAGKRPAVLVLHGTTAAAKNACVGLDPQNPGKGMAHHLAQRGFVTLSPDHFCAGERLAPGHKPYDTAPLYRRHPGWSAMGKDVWDHMRCVDYLATTRFVDADRIGVIGHSLGGHGAAFHAALDERVKAGVSSCGITAWRADPNRLNWSRKGEQTYIYFPKLRPIWEAGEQAPIDFHDILSLTAPRAFLNISAVGNDSCFPIFEPFAEIYVQVERVYKLLGAEGQFASFFHSEKHSLNGDARGLAYAWLEERLGSAQ